MKTRTSAIVAGLGFFLISQVGAAQELLKPKLLHTVTLAEGELSVNVWDHGIETRDGLLRCWTYVSKGMEARGQREIVFTLRRLPDLELGGFPEELFSLFGTIYDLATQGRTVDVGGFTVFRPGTTLLQRKGDWGLMYLPAETFDGIDLPPNALKAVLIRDHETEIIQQGFYYRVATSMAGAYRYYPCPPWSDPDRPAMATEERFGKSVLSKVPFRTMDGITAKIDLEASLPEELMPGITEGIGGPGSEIVLTIDPKSAPDLAAALDEIPAGGAHAWLTDPDPDASSRLCWDADTGMAIVLFPPSGPGSWMTGGFLLLGRAGKGLKEKVSVFEDGFAAILSPKSWKKLKKALASAEPVEIRDRGLALSLRVEFPEGQQGAKGKAAVMTNIVLFNTDEEFAKSGFRIDAMTGYLEGIWNAVSTILGGYPELGADGLLVCVAIRPKSKVKIWVEADEAEFDPAVLSKIGAELEKLKPPKVRRGTIAFSVAGPQWSGPEGGAPGFPKAWTEVVKNATKPMTIEEIIALLWKD
jgi:hypothetical protein